MLAKLEIFLLKLKSKIMKTTILFLAALVLSVSGNAQSTRGKSITSGKVIYEERARIEISFEGDASQSTDAIPRERISKRVLFFNSDFSLYQMDESKRGDEVLRTQKSHTSMRMIASGENDKTFCDLKNKKKVEQKEFMTRVFLIDGDIDAYVWKVTDKYRTLLGYDCREAVRAEKEKKISVWYAQSIPVPTGPSGYDGLPGLVLQVDINNGEQTITAISIDPSINDVSKLVMPGEGKKVTSEEYRKIVEAKLKEIRNDAGEGVDQ